MLATWNDTAKELQITRLARDGKILGYVRDDNYKNWVRIMFWRLMNIKEFRVIFIPILWQSLTARAMKSAIAQIRSDLPNRRYENKVSTYAPHFFAQRAKNLQFSGEYQPCVNFKGFREATATPNKRMANVYKRLIRHAHEGIWKATRYNEVIQSTSIITMPSVASMRDEIEYHKERNKTRPSMCVPVSRYCLEDGYWSANREIFAGYNYNKIREGKNEIYVPDRDFMPY